ncbi:SCO family protein [Halalkalibacter sp. APA_J-10(15)]|uniref:SCO family protein n=1 Tax=Halalkalibacter sp. APA_J-10(15) TaxID=2933805 RepID=UPI001FF60E2C|nr:SCO family protein [Halalkalibacter sp. APA_J-10(15)]MCK0472666.1 SCO family protein [Halalkalibacter sp. APA_J-10(15)]
MKRMMTIVLCMSILTGCGWVYEIGVNGEESGSTTDMTEAGNEVETFQFVNETGEPFGTEQLAGGYWVANFIFANCPSVCPLMTPNMLSLQDEMIAADVPVTFISFTVDPERDTPEILQAYGRNVGADLDSWHFLTGYDEADISEFALDSFLSVVQPSEDDIIHPTYFFLIDPDGLIIRKYDGLTTNQDAIIADLKETIQ